MSGAELAYLALGVAVGFGAFLLLGPANESDCCARVAAGVRDKVNDKLGSGAVAVGDALGVWKHTPGWLNALGV